MESIYSTTIRGSLNLYISCDGQSSPEVVRYVKDIKWRYGEFHVIQQNKQLGVDAHNLACMKMAKELDHVVVLEDDLIVSPSFQEYLLKAERLVKLERSISGISLYRYPIIEANHFPFELIPNNEFVYYMQRSSSKGCFYTWDMLEPYFSFLEDFDYNFSRYHLPENVLKWGDEVWEKSFYCYLQESGNYLAFCRYRSTYEKANFKICASVEALPLQRVWSI